LEQIRANEYLNFQNVNKKIVVLQEGLTAELSDELVKQESQYVVDSIGYFDQKKCIRIPRGHVSMYMVDYSPCYATFFHLFRFEGVSRKVCSKELLRGGCTAFAVCGRSEFHFDESRLPDSSTQTEGGQRFECGALQKSTGGRLL
jgi:hypothetical protein